ncbi:MAG: aldo/keto reductase [Rhodobacterales bacterium]|nr:MAG: aldo/keto reductase [Rhodobacterales bacterium]
MQMNELGRTGLMVSELCLGSMTWGTQNTQQEAHAQIDMALDHGVNFLDTAEMYPVNPVAAENVGKTESIIGNWLASSGRRSDLILATKVSGANGGFVREGRGISSETITEAVDGSLKRLQTDYIDLYQLHWPNRGSYMFRQNWEYDPSEQDKTHTMAHIHDVLGELGRQVEAGKIRHVGLSNESAWGTAMWLRASEQGYGPRMVSIQNEYSLLCRMFDTDLAELSVNEHVGLLAFSPLATGLLSGKYAPDLIPPGSRRTVNPGLGGRVSERVWGAISAYQQIADHHGLNICQMALAWCRSRPFMTSAIFGASNMEQLELALGSVHLTLSDQVLAEINAAHKAHPMPY